MAVIKASKSGKQLQFIADDGTVYGVSLGIVQKIIDEKNPARFCVLTQFPLKASPDRYPKSPIWYPDNFQGDVSDDSKAGTDVFSAHYRKNTEQKKQFEDKKIW